MKAAEFATQAYVGQRYRDADAPSTSSTRRELVTLRTGSPDAVKFASSLAAEPVRKCRVCGCTDDDCRQCVEKTGEPCTWVEEDLCSVCEAEELAPTAAAGDPFPAGELAAEAEKELEESPNSFQPAPLLDRVIDAEAGQAEAKKARKAESDRRYREKQRAKLALERAVGNRVESPASPAERPASVREPVITGPTAPVERLAPVDCCSVLSPTPDGFERVYTVIADQVITRKEARAGKNPRFHRRGRLPEP